MIKAYKAWFMIKAYKAWFMIKACQGKVHDQGMSRHGS